MDKILTHAVGWVVVGFMGMLAVTLVWQICTNKISFEKLLSEPNGDASLSRLQFLIFTFVIALSLFLVVVGHPGAPAFPASIPTEILTLLGISGSSYLVSKGIQFSNPAGIARPALAITPGTLGPPIAAGAQQVFSALAANAAPGNPQPAITWALDAPAEGTLEVLAQNQARYTAPAPLPAAPSNTVTIRAQAPGFEDATVVVKFR
jgi:hypothetical protein